MTGAPVPVCIESPELPRLPELDGITRLAASLTGAAHAVVNVFDAEHQYQLVSTALGWTMSPRTDSMCTAVMQSGSAVHVTDAAEDPRFADNPWVDGRRGSVRLYASAPLIRHGVAAGALCVWDEVPGELSPAQLSRLDDLAALVVAVMAWHRATEDSRDAHAGLLQAHEAMVRQRAFTDALLEALPVGVVAADADQRVTLFNRVSRRWHGRDTDQRLAPEDLAGAYDLFDADGVTPLPADQVPLLRAFTEDAVTDAEIVIRAHGAPPRTVSCSGTQIRDDDGGLLGAVVAMADITAQRQLEQQLRTAALHDGLTGLPNRSLLSDRLHHALESGVRGSTQVAVLYGDLDGFKAVNDRHGHDIGDEVLVLAANRLREHLRPGDTVARMGGDEFVLLCPDVAGVTEAKALAERITQAFVEPFVCSSGTQRVGISIGVAISGSDSQPATLLTSADRAMYRVKRARSATSPSAVPPSRP